MQQQRTLFDDEFSADMEAKRLARRTDPPTSHEAAEELVKSGRRETQCQAILERLRERPASSSALAAICLKYTSRISDLRQRGHVIQCVNSGGVYWYKLHESEGAG